ncbi:hypothetical protein [Marinimicrobium locisalis]|uniref:hypothetical protein n=1 Tax=Marinimicrobium locisalis TaxID=546022 RepID=UPI003221DBD9
MVSTEMVVLGQPEERALALLEAAVETELLELEEASLDAELAEVGDVPPLLPQAVSKTTLVPNKIREINIMNIPADKSLVQGGREAPA